MTRSVLLLTGHFPPSSAVAVHRMLGLVRYLPKFGWQPVVVAPPRVPWEPEDPALLSLVPPETPIERVPFAEGLVGRLAGYVSRELHWLLRARPACNRMIAEHRPEAVITSSPPHCLHLLGWWLKRRHGLPWLASFRDPWITNAWIEGKPLRSRMERWLEGRVMANADCLIANTPRCKVGWSAAYPAQAHKMVTITNGFDPETFRGAASLLVWNGARSVTISILHAGEFYAGRDPRPFLDALVGLPETCQVEFLGRNTQGQFDFASEIKARQLEKTAHVVGQVAHADAIERMLRSDILLLVQTPGYKNGVPAKLYEYLGAGRPILALAEPDSDIGWVLRQSQVLHRIVDPTDVAAIRLALIELIRDIHAGCPVSPDADALGQFTRERMAERFAECLDRCVPRKPAPPAMRLLASVKTGAAS